MSQPSADKRLERLLVMVPWIVDNNGATVDEVCSRFAITENQLVKDLELLFMCGLYPFTPDSLIEADVVDGRVWIRYADAFIRPPSLTAQEAVSLIAAGSAVMELPGNEDNDALKNALAKLSRVLGLDVEEAVDVDLASTSSRDLKFLRDAVEANQSIEVDYYSYGRDAWNSRVLQPYRIFNSEGNWYLQAADDVGTQAETGAQDSIKNFRVDRMKNLKITERKFSPPLTLPEPETYRPKNSDPLITIELDPSARWVVEQYPVESSQIIGDEKLRINIRVSEAIWIERLLLRLGNHAKVVDGDISVDHVVDRILRRYRTK